MEGQSYFGREIPEQNAIVDQALCCPAECLFQYQMPEYLHSAPGPVIRIALSSREPPSWKHPEYSPLCLNCTQEDGSGAVHTNQPRNQLSDQMQGLVNGHNGTCWTIDHVLPCPVFPATINQQNCSRQQIRCSDIYMIALATSSLMCCHQEEEQIKETFHLLFLVLIREKIAISSIILRSIRVSRFLRNDVVRMRDKEC